MAITLVPTALSARMPEARDALQTEQHGLEPDAANVRIDKATLH